MADDDEGFVCTCGQRLLDGIDPPQVTVEGETFPFRRTTDYVVCDNCGAVYRMTDLETRPRMRLLAQEIADLYREE